MRISLISFGAIHGIIWFYTNSLIGVNPTVKEYYSELQNELTNSGYKARMFVISGRRWGIDNWFLSQFGSASSKSRHKHGEAIDIIVLDVNDDGESNSQDVDIVYKLLNKKIIRSKGGIGPYKNESGFFNRQMVHFDCRGKRARWHR